MGAAPQPSPGSNTSIAARIANGAAGYQPMPDEQHDHGRPVRAAAPSFHCNDRQRSRRAGLPEPRQEHCADKIEPALGRGHHLHRDRDRVRLSRRDPRRLVTASCRLCDRQADRCTFGACRTSSRRRGAPTATRVHPSLRSRFAVRF